MNHLDQLRQVVSGEAKPPPIATFVGFRLAEVEEGRSVLEFEGVNAGRTVGLTECDLTDGEGRLVARASSTCMTLRQEALT